MENKELKVIDCVAEVAENSEVVETLGKAKGKKAAVIVVAGVVTTGIALLTKKLVSKIKAKKAEKKAKVEETSQDNETYDDSFEYEDK